MTPFDHYFHTIMTQGEYEAHQDHSATVEAHHLLLAIAGYEGTTAHRLLAEVGLDRGGVRAALDREFEHSLNAVGISAAAYHLPPAGGAPKSPGMGASAKLALERAFTTVRKKDLDSAHLLAGILRAQVGTVPRALALAGVDREALLNRAQAL
ncbi:Clp protease N-terminal domain-containing protein [Nonomuraea sp. NPDC059007]|uniref:Clp protease N-terminal domain-containing protein n=1 Tax=Nonomuraea sp. NPDC059007 TaxID=3346692 RepID=UPI0036B1FF75